jgi:hypothetical protein
VHSSRTIAQTPVKTHGLIILSSAQALGKCPTRWIHLKVEGQYVTSSQKSSTPELIQTESLRLCSGDLKFLTEPLFFNAHSVGREEDEENKMCVRRVASTHISRRSLDWLPLSTQ